MNVADIHLLPSNVGVWLFVIEGIAEMFVSAEGIEGSGASSWIGTAYGDRVVKLGLRMPAELPFGESDPYRSEIDDPAATAFTIVDFDGSVVALFHDDEPDETTDTLGGRISPIDDPAPDPAVGLNGEIITVWDRHVGIERIGPAGERRHFWLAPDDVPPGLDHFASEIWPPTRVSDNPSQWAGRKVAVYRIVQDPDDETWPSWQEQYEGGSLWWYGTLTDRGEWRDHKEDGPPAWVGRAHVAYALGPSSWQERAANLTRPTTWYKAQSGATLTGDELLVSVWIEAVEWEPIDYGFVVTVYESRTLRGTGNTLAGLTTATEIWSHIRDLVNSMVDGSDNGSVLGADNAQYIGPGPLGSLWNDGDPSRIKRRCQVSTNGSVIKIKCAEDEPKLGFKLGICADARVFQLAGWDIGTPVKPEFIAREDGPYNGACPVGGADWGEAVGDEQMPPGHVIALFSTRDETLVDYAKRSTWDNDGHWRAYTAPWPAGTVALDNDGPTDVFLGVGDPAPCEGQHGQPFTLGAQIDGNDVDAAGWWIFKGFRLTAADYLAALENGEETPEGTEYAGVAFCEWVTTSQSDAVELNSDAMATLRIVRWEYPPAFGLPFEPLTEPWVNVNGVLQCAPLGVIGGVAVPGWRHRIVPTILLSSGTSVWDDSGDEVTITPGVNQPGDIVSETVGDIEVADLGCGLPAPFVDWESFYRCASQLPDGPGGALNRVLYVLYGSEKLSAIMRECMAGAGWAWSLKRLAGGVVPAFGAYDPLRPIAPDEVEVTLRRSDMAELGIEDGPQWRGRIELRRGGPYDRFTFEVGKSPIDVGDFKPYVLTMESNDPGRRHRGGRIDWPVKDTGLRDPAPWLAVEGDPGKQVYDWTEQARERFASGFGPRLSKRQYIYRAVYNRRFAHLLGLGTAVHVIDSTAECPDGTRGLNHRGRVIEASIVARGTGLGSVRVAVELERKSVDDVHVWGPFGVSGVEGFDTDTITLAFDADFAVVENDWSDTTGFTKPSWDSHEPAPLLLYIAQSEDGQTYDPTLDVFAEVAAIDANTGTIEISSIVGDLYEDTIKVVFAAGMDQTAGWASAIFAPVCNPNGTSDGSTKGVRLK